MKDYKLFESFNKIYNADELYFCVTKIEGLDLTAIIVPKDYWNSNHCWDDSIGGHNVNNTDLNNGGLNTFEEMEGIFQSTHKIGKEALKQKMISAGFEFNDDICHSEADDYDDDDNTDDDDGSEQQGHRSKLFDYFSKSGAEVMGGAKISGSKTNDKIDKMFNLLIKNIENDKITVYVKDNKYVLKVGMFDEIYLENMTFLNNSKIDNFLNTIIFGSNQINVLNLRDGDKILVPNDYENLFYLCVSKTKQPLAPTPAIDYELKTNDISTKVDKMIDFLEKGSDPGLNKKLIRRSPL